MGPVENVPDNSNIILRGISWLEESVPTWQVVVAVAVAVISLNFVGQMFSQPVGQAKVAPVTQAVQTETIKPVASAAKNAVSSTPANTVNKAGNTASGYPTASNTATVDNRSGYTERQHGTVANKARYGIISGTDVRVRAGAGTNTYIKGYFERGERVEVLEVIEDWYKVRRNNGQIGWVSADFCRI